jgi:glycerol uptake facilitator-like aquaporin
LTDTFSGIRPLDVPGFIAVQLIGALAATVVWSWLSPSLPQVAKDVVVRHSKRKSTYGQ